MPEVGQSRANRPFRSLFLYLLEMTSHSHLDTLAVAVHDLTCFGYRQYGLLPQHAKAHVYVHTCLVTMLTDVV
jgi:hypothetical protein